MVGKQVSLKDTKEVKQTGMHHQPGEQYHSGLWFRLLGCTTHQDREYKVTHLKGR